MADTDPSVNSPLVARVRTALATVVDPEAGIDVVKLGLVYRIAEVAGGIEVDLTMTSPTCPMGDMIEDDARHAIAGVLPAGMPLALRIVWEPPWTPERMSPEARHHFGWDGD